jgi:hypothetical protein
MNINKLTPTILIANSKNFTNLFSILYI